MASLIVLTSVLFSTFVKCCFEVMSTHSINDDLHSIFDSFFVYGDEMKNKLEANYSDPYSCVSQVNSNPSHVTLKEVKVAFVNEKPKNNERCTGLNVKSCNVILIAICWSLYKVDLEFNRDLKPMNKKKYIVFLDKNKYPIFYCTGEKSNYKILRGVKDEEKKYFDNSSKLSKRIIIKDLGLRIWFSGNVDDLMKCLKRSDVIVIVATEEDDRITCFFSAYFWRKLEEVFSNNLEKISFTRFDGFDFELDDENLAKIRKDVDSLERQYPSRKIIWSDDSTEENLIVPFMKKKVFGSPNSIIVTIVLVCLIAVLLILVIALNK